MAVHEVLAWHAVQVLFFATWAVIGAATVWLLWVARRMPSEYLKLRLFNHHDQLYRALLFLGAGSFAGLMGLVPRVLGMPPPLFWLVAWTAAWAVAVGRGMVTLILVFRAPPNAAFAAPSSATDP